MFHIMHIAHLMHIIHIIHFIHIDSYACNALDRTLHACGTVLDVGVILLIDPINTHQHLILTMYA